MIINKLACESQVAGGVIMGVNYALFEERIMDRAHRPAGQRRHGVLQARRHRRTCRRFIVHMMDMPERGVIGIGEPPTISTLRRHRQRRLQRPGRARAGLRHSRPEKVLTALADRKEGTP